MGGSTCGVGATITPRTHSGWYRQARLVTQNGAVPSAMSPPVTQGMRGTMAVPP